MASQAEIGLIGLGVMGQNLALNIADHNFGVAVYNRTTARTEAFAASEEARTRPIVPCSTLEDLAGGLRSPRAIILMIQAGEATDGQIEALVPLLEPGDVIVDGGNARYQDTMRRERALGERGLRLLGTGISGGEEGARHGPSIMAGGAPEAYARVRSIFEAIAAKVDGAPCCAHLGPDGAGHFVKMLHNGIEYADMQAIAEAYHLLRSGGRSVAETAAVFRRWSSGPLNSYLIDITVTILEREDVDGEPLIEKVLDTAAQKGTGRWAVDAALDLGQPTTVITESVLARSLSALKDHRVEASRVLAGPQTGTGAEESDLESALLCTKIVGYAQGFMLIRAASGELGWTLDSSAIASLWRGGCIIRAALLSDITRAFQRQPELTNLLLDQHFAEVVGGAQEAWRRVVAGAVTDGVPVPAFSTGLAFYDGLRSERLPANLIQAQRDFFGAHTYERIDRPRGSSFHTDWTTGGANESGS